MGLIHAVGKLLTVKWALVGLGLVVAWEGYMLLKPPLPELDEPRRDVADRACWEAVGQLPSMPADALAVVCKLENDRTEYVTRKLREVIDRKGVVRLPPEGHWDRVREELKLPESEVIGRDEAGRVARWANASFAIYGRINRFTSDQSQGRIDMELHVLDVVTGEPLGPRIAVVAPKPGEGVVMGLTGFWRVVVWVLIVGLLPALSFPFIKQVLEKESNTATGLMLAAFAMVGWLIASAMVGFEVRHWLTTLLLVAAFGVALAYNYLAFSWIEAQRA